MSAVVQASCSCGSIGRSDLRQCPRCFHIWNGDRRLASVGSIVYASFPLDPSIPPDVLENARDRGTEADRLLASYCRSELQRIPAGTRKDSIALFEKARTWIDRQGFRKIEVQVLLGYEDHGGILDFRFDGVPVDLKCTYNVEQAALMQVAGYVCLDGKNGNGGHILHVTERFKEPKLVNVLEPEINDWRIILAHWRMVRRRTAK